MMLSTNNRNGFPSRELTETAILLLLLEKGGEVQIRDPKNSWTIYEELANRLNVSQAARNRPTKGKRPEPAWRPEVGFCRKNLVESKDLKKTAQSGWGIWALTDKGRQRALLLKSLQDKK